MAWPNDNIDTRSLERDTARPDRRAFLNAFRRIKDIIAALGQPGGPARLGNDGRIPAANLDIASAEEARTGRSNEKLITPATLAEAVPAGTITMWPTENPPANWLECNGRAISRANHPRLFAAIGTRYGRGNGRTTFNLPDGRGEFVRGWDHGRRADPDARTRTNRGDGTTGDNVGTRQGDQLREHDHDYSTLTGSREVSSGGARQDIVRTTTSSTSRTGGAETRGRNIALMLIIKT